MRARRLTATDKITRGMTTAGSGEGGGLSRRALIKGGLLAGGLITGGEALLLTAPDPAVASASAINQLLARASELGAAQVTVKLVGGTYNLTEPLAPTDGVVIEGERDGSTILRVADAAGCPAIETPEFETLVNSGEVGKGPSHFTLRNLTVDGNRAGNAAVVGSTRGDGINLYGRCYRIEDVIVRNCATDGIRTQDGLAPPFSPETDSIDTTLPDDAATSTSPDIVRTLRLPWTRWIRISPD